MVKRIRAVVKEIYDNPIRCPNCRRVLGNIVSLNGDAEITYICQKCGSDINIEIKS
jgi:transcription elongation factor Elf1